MNTSKGSGTVLVVDDIESIREAIAEFLSQDFHVLQAADGYEALEQVESHPIDLVISDIRMPGMGGLQLIRLLQEKHPEIQTALMTAYNVDDYIRFVREENVWNIIPKSTFLDLKYIRVMAHKLLGADIFGVSHYFDQVSCEDLKLADLHRIHRHKEDAADIRNRFMSFKISSPEENNAICDMIGDILCEHGAPSVMRMILEELSANAIIHAPGIRKKIKEAMLQEGQVETTPETETAETKISLETVQMGESDSFEIGFGVIDGNAVLTVTDFHGSLDQNEILLRLERQVTIDPQTNLPMGIIDYHGRGLYISREQLDHLIFNIESGARSEIIAIMDLNSSVRTRAISIYHQN